MDLLFFWWYSWVQISPRYDPVKFEPPSWDTSKLEWGWLSPVSSVCHNYSRASTLWNGWVVEWTLDFLATLFWNLASATWNWGEVGKMGGWHMLETCPYSPWLGAGEIGSLIFWATAAWSRSSVIPTSGGGEKEQVTDVWCSYWDLVDFLE